MRSTVSTVTPTSLPYKLNNEDTISILDNLPIEIIVVIFNYLPKSTKQTCRQVCEEWRQIIDRHFVKFVGILNDRTYEYIRASKKQFETIIVNSFHRALPVQEARSTFRSKLALSPRNLIFTYGSLEDSSAGTTSANNVATMLKLNRKVTSLRFRLNALKGISYLPIHNLLLPNLTKLEITVNREMMYENKTFHQITEIRMPSLTHLVFQIAKFIVFEHEKSGRFYLAMFQFLVKHRSTLVSVEMRNDYYLFFPLLSALNVSVPIGQEHLDSLLLDLLPLKLKEFSYLFKRPECYPPYNLGTHILSNQNQLNKLKIEERNDNGLLHPIIFRAIERNSPTLRQLFWRVFRFADNAPFTEITSVFVQTLKLCSHLESLSLCGFSIPSLSCFMKNPEKLRSLELEGAINPNVLLNIQEHCVNLESLKFYHLNSVERNKYDELALHLKAVMRLPKLRVINWYVQGLFLHYIPKRTDISIKRGKKGRHYYVITFTRS